MSTENEKLLRVIFGTARDDSRPQDDAGDEAHADADAIVGPPPRAIERVGGRRQHWYWAADAFRASLLKRHRPHLEQFAIAAARVDEVERYLGRMTQVERFEGGHQPRMWLKESVQQRADALRQLRGLKPFGATEG